MRIVFVATMIMMLTACGASQGGSAGTRAAKAEALGVTLANFETADPLLVAMAQDYNSLIAALSLAGAYPKAAKRQLRFEVNILAMDCISEFGTAETGFEGVIEAYSERAAKRPTKETKAEWDAFVMEMTIRLPANLQDLVDLSPLVPGDLAAALEAEKGTKATDIGSTPGECKRLAKAMKTRKYDF